MSIRKNSKILIIRFSSLGDVILTTPVLRALKRSYPNSKIDFVVREEYSDVLRHNTDVSKLFILKRSRENELVSELRDSSYDVLIDLQNNIRSRILRNKIRYDRIYRYRKPSLKKLVLVKFKVNLLKEQKSIPQRYAEAVPGLMLDDEGPDLYLPGSVKPVIDRNNITIGLCPGSKHFTKMWPEEYFIQLGKMLVENKFRVAIFGGKDDKIVCDNIARAIGSAKNFCNDNDLYQTAVDMKMCASVVTNDSGLMHIASAMKVPVIAIFGSTVREFGFSPYNVSNVVLENNLITCRPCTHIGREQCPKDHFKCMMEIKPLDVFKKVQEFIEKK